MATRRSAIGRGISQAGEAIAQGINTRKERELEQEAIARLQEQQQFLNELSLNQFGLQQEQFQAALEAQRLQSVLDFAAVLPPGSATLGMAFEIAPYMQESLVAQGLDPETVARLPLRQETLDSLKLGIVQDSLNSDSQDIRESMENFILDGQFITNADREFLKENQMLSVKAQSRQNQFILDMNETQFGEFIGMAPEGKWCNSYGCSYTLAGAQFLAGLDEMWLSYRLGSSQNSDEMYKRLYDTYEDQINRVTGGEAYDQFGVDAGIIDLLTRFTMGDETAQNALMEMMGDPNIDPALLGIISAPITGTMAARGMSEAEILQTFLSIFGDDVGAATRAFSAFQQGRAGDLDVKADRFGTKPSAFYIEGGATRRGTSGSTVERFLMTEQAVREREEWDQQYRLSGAEDRLDMLASINRDYGTAVSEERLGAIFGNQFAEDYARYYMPTPGPTPQDRAEQMPTSWDEARRMVGQISQGEGVQHELPVSNMIIQVTPDPRISSLLSAYTDDIGKIKGVGEKAFLDDFYKYNTQFVVAAQANNNRLGDQIQAKFRQIQRNIDSLYQSGGSGTSFATREERLLKAYAELESILSSIEGEGRR